jgi:hypothetical protein
VPDSLNVHASFSDATSDDEIRDPAASLVLPGSPLGYAQDPAGCAAPAKALVAGGRLTGTAPGDDDAAGQARHAERERRDPAVPGDALSH